MTSKRAAILQVLRESEGHLQPDEIYRRVKDVCPGIVLATVYNNLHALCEQGLIRHIHTAKGADYYDKTPESHEHAICAGCGKMLDLDMGDFAEYLAAHTNLPMHAWDFILHTTCADCRKKQEAL